MFNGGLEEEAELIFREQADGRKVAWLPTGKIALVHYDRLDEVKSGETWLVKLVHRDTFAVAYPLQKTRDASRPAPVSPSRMPQDDDEAQTQTQAQPETVTDSLRFQVSDRQEPVVEEPEVQDEEQEKPEGTPSVEREVPERPVLETVPSATDNPAHAITDTDRIAFFIDAANMDSACRDAGYFMDYRKAVRLFLGRGVFYAAYYYVADFTVEKDSRQVSFLDYLNYAGYVVRLKKVKRIVDRDTGQESFKANVDTEIVVDMLNTADNYDVAYLFSGDSDYERLVDILRSRGKRIYIVTSKNTLSRELAYVADKPIAFLEDHGEDLARET